MARGGKRAGTPGTAYKNRSDLQAVKVAPGEPYGVAQQLENAQRAIPLSNQANQLPAPAAPAPSGGAGPPMMATAGQQDFTRPSEQPNVPVTAGLPSGPGPGPEALSSLTQGQPDLIGAQLRAIFAQFPNDDLLRVMALHDQGH